MIAVRDIMQTDVVSVSTDTTARHLARILADEEISGAPVVDKSGRLVGVVSQTDLVRLAADESDVHLMASTLRGEVERIRDPDEEPVEPDPFGFFLPEDSPISARSFLDAIPESDFDTVMVGDIMTPVSFSVPPELPLAELAEFLVRGRIHRAVVVEEEQLVGIVTSNDVLKVVAEGRLTP